MSTPALAVNGQKFINTATGKEWKYVGVSDFALFKRWLMPNGPQALVAPRLDEWKELAHIGGYSGPIVLRVFAYGHANNPFGIPDPWSYDFRQITELTNYVATRGFYIDWTTGDSQHVIPERSGPRGQQEHLNKRCAAVAGSPNALIETSNESFKNGQLAEAGIVPPRWGSYLRDSGAYGESDNWPYGTELDYISYHGSRSRHDLWPVPFWVAEMWNSSVFLQKHGKPFVHKEPIGFAEQEIPGRRSASPQDAFQMGLVVAVSNGVLFHSQSGLEGHGLGPVQRACAANFFRGIAGGLLNVT